MGFRTVRLMLVLLTCLLLWAAVLWLLPASRAVRASPGTLFVTVSGTGTSCSQAQPCQLQTALAQSVSGDTLYVAGGTYTGSGAAVVTITKSITLYGGWDGAAGGTVLRNPAANPSILDGQGLRRGVHINGAIAPTVDGFTIRRGNATFGPEPGFGGGIYSRGASPLIAHNILTANVAYAGAESAWGYGGGLYLRGAPSRAVVRNNQVLANIASGPGGGMGGGMCIHSSPQVELLDNIVLDNTASITGGTGYGGGLAVVQSTGSTVAGNRVESNRGSTGSTADQGRGGGLYLEESNNVLLSDNRVRNNVASVAGPGYGGGIKANGVNDLLATGNWVEGNTAAARPGADAQGGGVFVRASLNANLSGNYVLGNTSNITMGLGGGLWMQSSSFTMTNNIVAGNRASDSGGGLALDGYEPAPLSAILLHNTFAGNDVGSGDGQVGVYLCSNWVSVRLVNNLFSSHSYGLCAVGGTATLSHTLFYGHAISDTCGAGTIVNAAAITGQDPLLDATYHLQPGSVAIDAGADAGVTTDIDGHARPTGDGYDIGADEYAQVRVYLPVVRRKK